VPAPDEPAIVLSSTAPLSETVQLALAFSAQSKRADAPQPP